MIKDYLELADPATLQALMVVAILLISWISAELILYVPKKRRKKD